MSTFPPETGRIDVALATATETIPQASAASGPLLYSIKADGWRLVINRGHRGVELRSRQGTDLTDRLPGIAAAAASRLSPGTVVDGELVVFHGGRFDWDALSRRMAAGRRPGANAPPPSYLGFDLLALNGQDLRRRPLRERWTLLEQLAASWRPPLQLVLQTEDRAEAVEWFHTLGEAGSEGLVVKSAGGRYTAGHQSGWRKVKLWTSVDLVVGAVIGPVNAPEAVVAGRFTDTGTLVIVGRTTALSSQQSRDLGSLLEAADPEQHPWPATIAGHFGAAAVAITHVLPRLVVEVQADTARQAGRYRHTVRLLRYRPELDPLDLSPLEPDGS